MFDGREQFRIIHGPERSSKDCWADRPAGGGLVNTDKVIIIGQPSVSGCASQAQQPQVDATRGLSVDLFKW